MARFSRSNDPNAVGRGWFVEHLWPSCRGELGYTATCALLAAASLALWRGTGQGILELATCCGLLGLDLFGIFGEALARATERKRRAATFLGSLLVRRGGSGEWVEMPGLDLLPGDVR